MNSTYYCPYDEETNEYRKLEKRKIKQRQNLELAITYGDLGRITMGKWGSRLVNAALIVTQFSFCVNYFIFMGDTITRMFPLADKNSTNTSENNSTFLRSSASSSHKHQGAPNVIFLMLIPFPFFLLQTFVRKVRSLGPMSAIANACVFFGFFFILAFILKGTNQSSFLLYLFSSHFSYHCITFLFKALTSVTSTKLTNGIFRHFQFSLVKWLELMKALEQLSN